MAPRPYPIMILTLALAAASGARAQMPPGMQEFEGQLRINRVVAIVGNREGTPSFKNDTWLGVTGPDGAYTTLDMVAFESGKDAYPGIQLEVYGCTKAHICPLGAGKIVGTLSGDAFNGQGDTTDAAVLFRTTEAQTLTGNGMGTEFWYTPNGSTAFTLGMALSKGGRGGVTIGKPAGGADGDAGPATLNVQGAIYQNGEPVVVAAGGHLEAPRSNAPKACGALADGSTDNAGEVTNGAPVTACAVSFHTAWSKRPFCTATAEGPGAGAVWLSSVEPRGFVFNSASAFAGAWTFTCL